MKNAILLLLLVVGNSTAPAAEHSTGVRAERARREAIKKKAQEEAIAARDKAGEQPPVLIKEVPAVIPPEAKKAGVGAILELMLAIDATGKVTEVKVVRSTNPAYDAPIVQAVMRQRYIPGKKNGEACAWLMPLIVNYPPWHESKVLNAKAHEAPPPTP